MVHDDPLNIIQHCASCQSKCCHGDIVIATTAERQNILDADHPDYFHKVTWNRQPYYLLDFHGEQSCRYLSDDGMCTIQEVKPHLCRIYPARLDENDAIVFKPSCPASAFLGDDFRNAIRKTLLYTYYHAVPLRVFDGLILKYLGQSQPGQWMLLFNKLRDRCGKYLH